MYFDRPLHDRIVRHLVAAVAGAVPQRDPFPHCFVEKIFPEDVYEAALAAWPAADAFAAASRRHHTDEYGGSTRRRMKLVEQSLATLPIPERRLWTTLRVAIAAPEVRRAVFGRVSAGLARRFDTTPEEAAAIEAYPRDVLYSETRGYRIAPHPDTREKIVTMQFAFPPDARMEQVGTEFYARSANPLHWLREPRGFTVRGTMPFRPNCAYAFAVLNTIGLKSWHGRSKIESIDGERNSLLHIWYAVPDESHAELGGYLAAAVPVRRAA